MEKTINKAMSKRKTDKKSTKTENPGHQPNPTNPGVGIPARAEGVIEPTENLGEDE